MKEGGEKEKLGVGVGVWGGRRGRYVCILICALDTYIQTGRFVVVVIFAPLDPRTHFVFFVSPTPSPPSTTYRAYVSCCWLAPEEENNMYCAHDASPFFQK